MNPNYRCLGNRHFPSQKSRVCSPLGNLVRLHPSTESLLKYIRQFTSKRHALFFFKEKGNYSELARRENSQTFRIHSEEFPCFQRRTLVDPKLHLRLVQAIRRSNIYISSQILHCTRLLTEKDHI